MKLPKEISPNPLLTSTVEVRFTSKLSENDILGVFYPLFGKDFPKISERGIPRDMKKIDPTLEFATDFVLSNDHYSVSVGVNAIAFENIGTYHLWENYFPIIKANLEKLAGLNVVTSVIRIGVRYASMFDGHQRQMKKILKPTIGFTYPGYQEVVSMYQANFIKNNTNLFVQIIPDANSQPIPGRGIRTGFYIDIDASISGNGDLKIGGQLYDMIDKLHLEEKEFFFSLLNENFIQSLNPKY